MDNKDIAQFWKQALVDLACIPLETEVVEYEPDGLLTEYVRTFHIYSVRITSADGVKIRGWLTLPIGTPPPGGWPAILTVPGYKGVQPLPLHYTRYGYATLALYPRSQGESEKEWKIDHGTYATYNIFDKNKYFYRGAYLDCVRGVDFLMTHPDINGSKIGCYGMSQGGGLVLALGSLDDRIRVVASEVGWPLEMAKIAESTAPAARSIRAIIVENPDKRDLILDNLKYFDPVNMVSNIKCPVILNAVQVDDLHLYESNRRGFQQYSDAKSSLWLSTHGTWYPRRLCGTYSRMV
ncbi:acetylxylan esterase [Ochrobactrum teleogrylli]